MEQPGFLEDRVERLQRDVAEIKTNTSRIDSKFDAKLGELDKSLTAHRLETRDSISALRSDMQANQVESEKSFGALRVELLTMQVKAEKSFGDLRADMKGMQAMLERSSGELRAEMKAMQVSMMKWVIGTSVALVTSMAGVLRFLS